MLIKYQALPGALNKKTYALYVLVGSDPYLLNDSALQIKSNNARHGEYSTTIIDINTASDWSLLIAEANSYSLFSDLVLLDARFDKKTIDAAGKGLLVQYLNNINDRSLIILRAPLVTAKSIQWLVDSPHVLVVQIFPFQSSALKLWIDTQFKLRNLRAEYQVTNLIQQYTEGNMLATEQLIEKLSLSVLPGELITETLLREQLKDESHFEIYELAEACLDANPIKALRLLQQSRLEQIEPTYVLWILTQEVRLLIQLIHLTNQSLSFDSACSQLKIWSSRIKFYSKAMGRLSLHELEILIQECKELDELIKTTQNSQIWNKFDFIALALSNGIK